MGVSAEGVWAIDVGRAALKALKLTPGEQADRVEAEAFDYIEYPHILGQPGSDPDDDVRRALATFQARNQLNGCRIAVAVPGRAALVRFFRTPPGCGRKEVAKLIELESHQTIPFAREQVFFDCQVLGGGNVEGAAEVVMFCIIRDCVRRAIRPLVVAGIEVDLAQIAPVALFNFFAFDTSEGASGDGQALLLDVGTDDTDLIITDGMRFWQRKVPIGGNQFTLGLAKGLGLTIAEAERLKRHVAQGPHPEAVFTALSRVCDDFVREVVRSIGFWKSINPSAKVNRVVGLGNGFKLPGLLEHLQRDLTIVVETPEVFERLVGGEANVVLRLRENLSSFGVCYGLALQGLARAPIRTNLLPPEWRAIRGWSPGAVAGRVRRCFLETLNRRDRILAPSKPVEQGPPRKSQPPTCPACRAEWPSLDLDECPTCSWQRYPGADRAMWGRVGRCPRCGFSYRWDGQKCFHCDPATAEPTDRESSGPVGGD